MTKTRIYSFDFIKAICMILIYLSHCTGFFAYNVPYVLHYTKPLRVNAFFVLSGYFLFKKLLSCEKNKENDVLKTLLSNNLYAIILPSIFFSALFYIPKVMTGRTEFSWYDLINDTFLGGTYWFISALVVANMIILCLYKLGLKNIWVYLSGALILAFLGSCLGENLGLQSDFWYYKPGLISVIYLVTGGVFFKFHEYLSKIYKSKFIYIIFGLVYLYVTTDYAWSCNTVGCKFDIIGFVNVVIGTIFLISIGYHLKESSTLKFIGKNTFMLYMVCNGIPFMLLKCFNYFNINHNALSFIIYVSLSLLIASLICVVINRYFPYLKDFRKLKKEKA